ncbi:MAG: hypothetical protein H7329_18580 [Opitutaceae bacterium]|nr:hypothetical protein [Cytophagales bacterium]
MKYLIPLFLAIGILSSCKKSKAKDVLDVPFRFTEKSEFTLPKMADMVVALPETTITFNTPEVTNTIPGEFSKNNLDINKVKSVVIEGLSLNIKSPSTQKFDFVKKIRIFLGAKGIGEQLIATKDNINSITPSPSSISLDPTGNDISAYIKSPTYYLKIETVLVKTYTNDIVIESEIKFLAIVNVLN